MKKNPSLKTLSTTIRRDSVQTTLLALLIIVLSSLLLLPKQKNLEYTILKHIPQYQVELQNSTSNIGDVGSALSNKLFLDTSGLIEFEQRESNQITRAIVLVLPLLWIMLCVKFTKTVSPQISMSRKEKLHFLMLIIGSGTLFAFFYHYALGNYLILKPPHNSFLVDARYKFGDFVDVFLLARNLNPYDVGNGWGGYFPLSYFIVYPFTFLAKNLAFGCFLVLVVTGYLILTVKLLQLDKFSFENMMFVAIAALFSYPLLFCLDRGNIEIVVFLFLGTFAYFFEKERYLLSSFFLALATAMKLYPGIFALLFLSKKKYKEFALTLLLAGAISLMGFSIVQGDPTGNFLNWLRAIASYDKIMVAEGSGWAFSTSFFTAIKASEHAFLNGKDLIKGLSTALNALSVFAICIYVLRVKDALWKKLALLTIAITLCLKISPDYRLIHFYIPLYLFLNEKKESSADFSYLLILSLLFIPKNYLYFYGRVSSSVLITPLLLMGLAGLIFYEKFHGLREIKR